MKKLSIIALLIFLASILTQAEPYLAFRSGIKCSQCHINKSGGGKRTNFGVAYASSQLSGNYLVGEDEDFFDGQINDYVSVGANYRIEEGFAAPYRYSSETNNGNPVNDSVSQNFTRSQTITEGNIYFQFDLIPNLFVLYWDVTASPSVSTREIFGMIHTHTFYVKYGTILSPFGLRLIDNQENFVTRQKYNYSTSTTSVEVGYEPGTFSFIVNSTLVNSSTSTQNTLATAQYIHPNFRVGYSFGYRTEQNLITPANISNDNEYAVFGGFGFENFTLFFDYHQYTTRSDNLSPPHLISNALFVEADYLVSNGVNLKAIYTSSRSNVVISPSRNLNIAYTMGVEFFPNPFLIVSLLGKLRQGIPDNVVANQDNISLIFHLHL